MDISFWFDTIILGWSIELIEGSQVISVLPKYAFRRQKYHTVYPVTSNAGMFYSRECKHENTQGKKICNLSLSIVPILNFTVESSCQKAFFYMMNQQNCRFV